MKTALLIFIAVCTAHILIFPQHEDVQVLAVSAWIWCFVAWSESKRADLWKKAHEELTVNLYHFLDKSLEEDKPV